jgi:hypothetical protein
MSQKEKNSNDSNKYLFSQFEIAHLLIYIFKNAFEEEFKCLAIQSLEQNGISRN